MAGQSKALRIGVITAAVVGTIAIPATALAANASGVDLRNIAGATIAGQLHAAGQAGDSQDAARVDKHLEALAKSLNITVDQLKAATTATRTELGTQKPATPADRKALDDKYQTTLAAKLGITVDALKAAEQASRPTGAPKGERPAGPGRPGPRGGEMKDHAQALATALGVTPEALKTATEAARTETKPTTKPADEAARKAHEQAFVAALAAKLNLPVEKVQAALDASKPAKPTAAEQKAMIQPRLAQMVAAGKLTQAQADQILADIDAGKPVFEILKQFMPQLGGGQHAPGGPGGRGPGAKPQGTGA